MDKRLSAAMLTLLLAVGGSVHAQAPAEQAPAIPVKGYTLVWSDEFDGTTLDTKKWDYRGLGPRRDAVNVKDTVALDGKGHLVLTTKMSLEVGKWAGAIANATLPDSLTVDYVRVYQQKETDRACARR